MPARILRVGLIAAIVTVCQVQFGSNASVPYDCISRPVATFAADFQKFGVSQYTSFHHRNRMKLVKDPVLDSKYKVLKMSVQRDDVGATSNPRAQMSTPGRTLEECTEFWASVTLMIPKFSKTELKAIARSKGHIMYAQIYGYPWAATAPLRIGWNYDSENKRHQFGVGGVSIDGSSIHAEDIWRITPVVDRWITVAVHMKMSTDAADGFVEVYADLGDGNGLRRQILDGDVLRKNYATLNAANHEKEAYRGNSMDLNVYRPKRMAIEEVTAYFGDNRIGNSICDIYAGNRFLTPDVELAADCEKQPG